jgi:hypothetical protein
VPPRSERRQLGLFGNPVSDFSLEELSQTVRMLEREQPGRTVDELSRAVFAELAMKQTRRAAELVAEAIRVARAGEPWPEITGSRWQASTQEVRAGRAGPASGLAAAAASRSRRSRRTTRHTPVARTELPPPQEAGMDYQNWEEREEWRRKGATLSDKTAGRSSA